jgi:hypothetical protein
MCTRATSHSIAWNHSRRNDSDVRNLIDQQLQFDASGTSVVAGVVTSISIVVA